MKNKKRKTGEEIKENKKKIKQTKVCYLPFVDSFSDGIQLDPSKNLTTAELLAQNNSGEKLPEKSSDAIAGPSTTLSPLPPTASISELRAKLQKRLQTFRSRRGAGDGEETHDGASVSSRDALEEERRRKRGEMRDRRRNERKEERRKEREGKAEKKEKKVAQQGPDDVRAKTAKTQLIVPQLKNTNNDEDISFPAISLPSKQSDKSGTHLKRISNPSQALAHLEKHKAKLAAMPDDKRAEIEEKERWAKAEERAKGGKVADQEKVLKNAVKRKEKTKAKSSKEWYVYISLTLLSLLLADRFDTGLNESASLRSQTQSPSKSVTTTLPSVQRIGGTSVRGVARIRARIRARGKAPRRDDRGLRGRNERLYYTARHIPPSNLLFSMYLHIYNHNFLCSEFRPFYSPS